MELASKTVFHMRHLVKAVYSGQLSGGLFHCSAYRFGACTVEDLKDKRNCTFRLGCVGSTLINVGALAANKAIEIVRGKNRVSATKDL